MAHSNAGMFDVIAIASSAGGFKPMIEIISGLPSDFPASVLVVQHTSPDHESALPEILRRHTSMVVKEAAGGEKLSKATVYTAKPNRHLMVNPDGTISLGSNERVHFVRPAADILFITMAISYRNKAIAIILSGTGQDGAIGSLAITKAGGKVIVQEDPEYKDMPEAAIKVDDVDFILPLEEIAPLLIKLVMKDNLLESALVPSINYAIV